MPVAQVLVIVQNAPVPDDRRVWQECLTLAAAGYSVAVICPRGASEATRTVMELRNGIEIHRFSVSADGSGLVAHVLEYAWSAVQILRLMARLSRRRSFDVVQVCNPPDFLALLALPLRAKGSRILLDHHDLMPEMLAARHPRVSRKAQRLMIAMERLNFWAADGALSTNESYRRVAVTRGKMNPADVTVVRNAPDLRVFQPVEPEPRLKHGRPFLLAYVGVMDPHDNVDVAMHALRSLRRMRDDWYAIFVGEGSSLPALRQLAIDLELDDSIEFAGWQDDDALVRVLSTADVCISPESKTPYNNASTFIKIAEYLAMERPVVCFDLVETRFTAQGAAAYVRCGDVDGFACCISELLNDPARRAQMGAAGRRRVSGELAWRNSEEALLQTYARLVQRRRHGCGADGRHSSRRRFRRRAMLEVRHARR